MEEKRRASAYAAVAVIRPADMLLPAARNTDILKGLQAVCAAKAAPQGPGASTGGASQGLSLIRRDHFRIMRFHGTAATAAPGGQPHPILWAMIAPKVRRDSAGRAENIRGPAEMRPEDDFLPVMEEKPFRMP